MPSGFAYLVIAGEDPAFVYWCPLPSTQRGLGKLTSRKKSKRKNEDSLYPCVLSVGFAKATACRSSASVIFQPWPDSAASGCM